MQKKEQQTLFSILLFLDIEEIYIEFNFPLLLVLYIVHFCTSLNLLEFKVTYILKIG